MCAPNEHAEIFWQERVRCQSRLSYIDIAFYRKMCWATVRTETRLKAHGHLLLPPFGSFRNCRNLACTVTNEQLVLDTYVCVLYIY